MNIGVSLIFIIKRFAPPRHDGFASKVFNKAPTLRNYSANMYR